MNAPEPVAGRESARPRRVRRWALAAVGVGAILLVVDFATDVEPNGSRARVARAHHDVQHIASAGVEAFRKARGRYPTTEEGIALLIREGFLGYNAPDGTLQDPWSRPYLYRCPGLVHPDRFDVTTYGADGKVGGEGKDADITNE